MLDHFCKCARLESLASKQMKNQHLAKNEDGEKKREKDDTE